MANVNYRPTSAQQSSWGYRMPLTAPSTISNIILDSAYSFGVGGDAMMAAFVSPATADLTDIWVCVSAFTGTWSATDQAVNFEIREGWGTLNYTPSSTLVASGTIPLTTGQAGQYARRSGLSVALQHDKAYTLVIGDADGNATNYVSLRYNIRSATSVCCFHNNGQTTTNGWTTAGTSVGYPIAVAVKIGGVVHCAAMGYQGVNRAATTYRRGVRMRILPGYPPLQLLGWYVGTSATWDLYVYRGAGKIPNDTPDWSETFAAWPGGGTQTVPVRFVPPNDAYVLLPGETYYIVVKPAANINWVPKLQMFGGMDADLRTLLSPTPGVEIADAIQNAAGDAWVIDIDASCDLALLLSPVNVTRSSAFIG
jgi:hypothetical protein